MGSSCRCSVDGWMDGCYGRPPYIGGRPSTINHSTPPASPSIRRRRPAGRRRRRERGLEVGVVDPGLLGEPEAPLGVVGGEGDGGGGGAAAADLDVDLAAARAGGDADLGPVGARVGGIAFGGGPGAGGARRAWAALRASLRGPSVA